MKTLKKLFETSPSYMKWGNGRLATKTGLKESTIKTFKNSIEFLEMKRLYLQTC